MFELPKTWESPLIKDGWMMTSSGIILPELLYINGMTEGLERCSFCAISPTSFNLCVFRFVVPNI